MQFRLRTLVIVAPLLVGAICAAIGYVWQAPILGFVAAELLVILAAAVLMDHLERRGVAEFWAALAALGFALVFGLAAFALGAVATLSSR